MLLIDQFILLKDVIYEVFIKKSKIS